MFFVVDIFDNSSVKRSFNSAIYHFFTVLDDTSGASKYVWAVPASIAVVIFSGPDLKSIVSISLLHLGLLFSKASMIDFFIVPTPSPVFLDEDWECLK